MAKKKAHSATTVAQQQFDQYYMGVDEAAQDMGVMKESVRRYIRTGLLPAASVALAGANGYVLARDVVAAFKASHDPRPHRSAVVKVDLVPVMPDRPFPEETEVSVTEQQNKIGLHINEGKNVFLNMAFDRPLAEALHAQLGEVLNGHD